MSVVVTLTGLPGTGKTALGLALGAAWSAHAPWYLLHTDLLKVTLRHEGVPLPGPTWTTPTFCEQVRPILLAHAKKARRDGYNLLVEGTLAVGLPADLVLVLTLDEPTRLARIHAKHPSALQALREDDLAPYQRYLCEHTPAEARYLDASLPIAELVTSLPRPG